MSHYVGFDLSEGEARDGKVECLGETPKRTRETRVLPGTAEESA